MESPIPDRLALDLNRMQLELYSEGVPVLIVFEGSSGRIIWRVINEIIRTLEPRGVEYHHFDPQAENNPNSVLDFLKYTPGAGKISLYDRSWYSLMIDRYSDDEEWLDCHLENINRYEDYLTDNGVLLIKILLRATPSILERYGSEYGPDDSAGKTYLSADHIDPVKYRAMMLDRIYNRTDTESCPWSQIISGNLSETASAVVEEIIERMKSSVKKNSKSKYADQERKYPNPRDNIDLSVKCKDYGESLAELSEELAELQMKLAEGNRSVVLGFEGWDAAGKGSCIKHLCHALNPRGYRISQTKTPTEDELAHTYLWRFCDSIPSAGRITIFDRTWYGRMMVEPIEDLCTREEYDRAASEINYFERIMHNNNTIIIKFWLDISKEEQLKRFEKRRDDPLKRWKITDEDWRNRSKWDEYDRYVDAMIESTNTEYAPWTVIGSDDKKYARVKVMETVVKVLKEQLDGDPSTLFVD